MKVFVGVPSDALVVVAGGVALVAAGLVFEALALLDEPAPFEFVDWLELQPAPRASVMMASVIVSKLLRRIFIFISSEPILSWRTPPARA
jgi:hypothetical protein